VELDGRFKLCAPPRSEKAWRLPQKIAEQTQTLQHSKLGTTCWQAVDVCASAAGPFGIQYTVENAIFIQIAGGAVITQTAPWCQQMECT
jgi:hypothetical protein